MSLDATPYGENSNSFCDVPSADMYHFSRLHNAEWAVASNKEKEAALITATNILDAKEWHGRLNPDSTQALRFPREDLYDQDGREVVGIPSFLVKATSELALHLLREESVDPSKTVATKRIKADVVEMEYYEPLTSSDNVPKVVSDYIKYFVKSSSNNVHIIRS